MKKNIWIHVGMVAAMLAVSLIYFSPALGGKIVKQGDIQSYEAMIKETTDFHEQTGEYAHWNSAMFSGMPGYQVGGNPPVKSVYQPMRQVGTLGFLGMDRNAGVLFFYLIGFYIALMALGCKPWLSLVGALAFGLGSYNIIIIEAGHITKAWSLAMAAPILAGMILCLRKPREGKDKWKDWLWGGILFTLALGLQLLCNHIQITYYTVIGAVLLGITYAVVSLKQRYFKEFLIAVGILIAGAAISFACNSRNLMVSQEYANVTMRGGNELTVTPDDLYHNGNPSKQNTSNGLDINYAFSWSYGIGETYTLLVPGAMGGGSRELINSDECQFYNTFMQRYYDPVRQPYPWGEDRAPLYWGGQPGTSGPVYFGAIIFMLFLMGMMVVKGADRWWILAATLISIMLSWGLNFLWLNEWVFNNLPLYNKFRTPSMALVLTNVCMVLMAVLTLKHIFNPKNTEADRKRILRSLYISAGCLLTLILGVMIFASLNFTAPGEQYPDDLMAGLRSDRESLFMGDSWRSIIFILLAATTIWLYAKQKIKNSGVVLAIVGVLIVIDLWGIDRRYLNNDNFIDKEDTELSMAKAAEYKEDVVDQMAAQLGDTNYRVYNLYGRNPFNLSYPSAFHHQIGGYSAVKMSRYQNLIDFYINYGNMNVFNMLNTRYIVTPQGQVEVNPGALGCCWLVDSLKTVTTVNEEILALNDFNPATTAVVNTKEFPDMAKFSSTSDNNDFIRIEHQTPYNPDYLKYRSHTASTRLAVFSEIYYAPDWRVYIDEKPVDHFRVNYVLRGLVIPAGDHVIEFRNEAPLFHKMDTINILASVVLVLLIGGAIFLVYRKKEKKA